jgi:hypothetical protein
MYRLDGTKVTAEENETSINVDHYGEVFSIYTTAAKVASMLERKFPDYYRLADDGASATANSVPLKFITKLWMSTLKP